MNSRPEPETTGEATREALSASDHARQTTPAAIIERDPVCGMTVDPRRPRGGSFDHGGHRYFFCGGKCRERFTAEPRKFLDDRADPTPLPPTPAPSNAPRREPPSAAPNDADYVCPMHPEVHQSTPGPCPQCGMALEPARRSPGQQNPELTDMARRFKVAAALAVPLFLISMLEMFGPHSAAPPRAGAALGMLEFALATPVCIWCGWPFLERAWRSLQTRQLNMFTLIGLGVSVTYVYSVVALLAPRAFPVSGSSAAHHGGVALYFESAALIVAFALLGQVLELRARTKTGSAIEKLLALAPPTARRVEQNGDERDVPLSELRVGDLLRVLPGQRVPVDAIVREGSSLVDESLVTGEPMPSAKSTGATVIGGTLNGNGSLLVQVAKVGNDTLLSRIVVHVAEAQRSRAPIQRLVDRVSSFFVPSVVAVSLLTFVLWFVFGPEPRFAHALVNAVAVLVVACPCALGLATPMSILVASGKGAEFGVLFKNAEALERLPRVDTLVVDKTGTLTEGRPTLTSVIGLAELAAEHPGLEARSGVALGDGTEPRTYDAREVVRLSASLERMSEHPLAKAVLRGAEERGIAASSVASFESITGKGLRGIIDGQQVALGNAGLVPASAAFTAHAEAWQGLGQTVVFLQVAGVCVGLLGISDPIKPGAAKALRALEDSGVHVVMLTGDRAATARAVARQLGISDVMADVLPDHKAHAIERLQRAGHVVAMAGDGINDAPALARADVGIAMGGGSDIAIESASLTLLRGDLEGIARARGLSRRTLANIRQNLWFAFLYNALGVPIAAGALYPVFGISLSPMLAALAMSLSSVSVIGNALRLQRVSPSEFV